MTMTACPTCGQRLPAVLPEPVPDPALTLARSLLADHGPLTARQAAAIVRGTATPMPAELEQARRMLERAVRAGVAGRSTGTVLGTSLPQVTYALTADAPATG